MGRADPPLDLSVLGLGDYKWAWVATKLKITSFVKYMPSVSVMDIESYSENCLRQAIRDIKGLPIGLQNGVLSYNVIISEAISPDAIAFATSCPKKHYSAFEIPVLYDLDRHGLYFYQGEILWGKVYESFLKAYLVKHFYVT